MISVFNYINKNVEIYIQSLRERERAPRTARRSGRWRGREEKIEKESKKVTNDNKEEKIEKKKKARNKQ